MLYNIYRNLTALGGPALRLMTQQRLRNKKEDPKRFRERYGVTTTPRPSGKVMWCHGASVGESLSVLPLLNTLQARLPDWHFVLTTNTVTSAAIMAQRLPARCTHQFVPWDHPSWVKRFMDHWRPDAVIWLESELWPNMLAEIKKHYIPTALLNARMRPATAKTWEKAHSLIAQMLATFRFILVGARDYRPVFEKFGGKNVRYIGCLKFGAQALPVKADMLQQLKDAIGTRRVIALLSSHATEEALFADALIALKKEFPDILGIIAPRKPERATDILDELQSKGLNVTQRSTGQMITAQTDIYLADTMGELGLWYALSPLAVIGGSFIPHGGQNPIEGTHFGTAVLYGPHMFNFIELCAALEQANAAHAVPTAHALLPTLQHLLRHTNELETMRTAAHELATQNISVIDAFANEIIIQLVQG